MTKSPHANRFSSINSIADLPKSFKTDRAGEEGSTRSVIQWTLFFIGSDVLFRPFDDGLRQGNGFLVLFFRDGFYVGGVAG